MTLNTEAMAEAIEPAMYMTEKAVQLSKEPNSRCRPNVEGLKLLPGVEASTEFLVSFSAFWINFDGLF